MLRFWEDVDLKLAYIYLLRFIWGSVKLDGSPNKRGYWICILMQNFKMRVITINNSFSLSNNYVYYLPVSTMQTKHLDVSDYQEFLVCDSKHLID